MNIADSVEHAFIMEVIVSEKQFTVSGFTPLAWSTLWALSTYTGGHIVAIFD